MLRCAGVCDDADGAAVLNGAAQLERPPEMFPLGGREAAVGEMRDELQPLLILSAGQRK